MAHWLLSIEAQDRPGIVASVTRSLADEGCNLADVSMTRLSGVFVMLAVVISPGETEPAVSVADIGEGASASWSMITDETASPLITQGNRWHVTVYGSDKPGLVAMVTNALAEFGANIDDLSTRLVGDDVYTMMIEVTIPDGIDESHVRDQLSALGNHLGITCHAAPVDTDTL